MLRPNVVRCSSDRLPALIARAGRAARTVAVLRARLDRLLAAARPDAAMLERVHQDLLQGYAACRLLLDLAIAHGGEPASDLSLITDGLARFERLARAWLVLSEPGAESTSGPALDELLRDLCDLLATEAAMESSAWAHRRAELLAPDLLDRTAQAA